MTWQSGSESYHKKVENCQNLHRLFFHVLPMPSPLFSWTSYIFQICPNSTDENLLGFQWKQRLITPNQCRHSGRSGNRGPEDVLRSFTLYTVFGLFLLTTDWETRSAVCSVIVLVNIYVLMSLNLTRITRIRTLTDSIHMHVSQHVPSTGDSLYEGKSVNILIFSIRSIGSDNYAKSVSNCTTVHVRTYLESSAVSKYACTMYHTMFNQWLSYYRILIIRWTKRPLDAASQHFERLLKQRDEWNLPRPWPRSTLQARA